VNAETEQPAPPDDGAARTLPARPRPLVLPTLAFMLGIILSAFLAPATRGVPAVAVVLPFAAFALFLFLATRRAAGSLLLQGLIIVIALGVGFARHQAALRLEPNHVAHLLADEPILTRLAGRIITQPTTVPGEKRNPFLPTEPPPRTHFVLSASELRTTDPPAAITGLIRVSVDAERIDARMGDQVIVTGRLYAPRGPRNPGEMDWARWNRLQNIHAELSVDGAVHVQRVESARHGVHGWIGWLRAYVQSLLFEPFTQTESDQPLRLLDAMVLGHRSAAGRQLNEAFLRTGTIHFLTVSGFHVGVLAGAVWLLVRRLLRRGARTAALSTMAVLVLYALIVEHNAPVLRAVTMGLLLCLAQLMRRPFCGLNWLAFSALCVLAYNPFELFRVGFQLSFVQVLALLTFVPAVYRILVRRRRDDEVPADADTWPALIARWLWRWLVGLAVVCVCAWLIALPLVLYHFGRFAPWGALQSIVISPLVTVTIVLGFFTLIARVILPPLGVCLGLLLRGATEWLLDAVGALARLPGTLLEVRRPPVLLVAATYVLFMWLLWVLLWRRGQAGRARPGAPSENARRARRRRLTKIVAAVSTIGMVACLWSGWAAVPAGRSSRDCSVHVLSVGSGSAVLIAAPDEHTLLCDVGTMYNFDAGETVVRAAQTLGLPRLDGLALSHANFDHYSGVASVLQRLPTAQLLLSPYFETAAPENPAARRFLEMLPPKPPRMRLRSGDRLALGQASIEVLWPPDDLDEGWSVNDRSLVLRVSAFGRSVMLPGDIEQQAMRALLDRHESGQINLFSDVLIAPHHGSVGPSGTAAFYEAVSPQVVVVSSSHERPKIAAIVRETLGDGVRVLNTHEIGAATIRLTPGGGLAVETPFAGTVGH
jgi:competence protein ComEC